MTAAIDRMETRHLVARADQRYRPPRLGHSPDARGQGAHHQVFAGHQDAMEKAMSGLSRPHRATLTDLLKRLGTTAEAQLSQEKAVTR
jgi:hypothetical protein